MLFETEKKAENFIKFNSEEIEEEAGFKPERTYFCIACNGWHVTSQKEFLKLKSKTEIIEDLYIKQKASVQKQKKEQQVLTQAQKIEKKAFILTQKIEKFKKDINSVETYIAILENFQENKNKSVELLNNAFV
jgi:vacuolar-type H+-ATPase subunit I/STV1